LANSNCAVIVAAGRSQRMAGDDKLWAELRGPDSVARPLLAYSIAAFQSCDAVSRIALVIAENRVDQARVLVDREGYEKVAAIVIGGARRQDSVRAGLEALSTCDNVAVHDGARPLVTPELIEASLASAEATGAACCAIPVPDTVKETAAGAIVRTVDRSNLMLAQTPQAFRYDLLMDAHKRCTDDVTDDASMLEALGIHVRIVPGSRRNLKVTTRDDLALAQALLTTT
jgi:2-C-methyl-D-erythritol 4-phosphate cytidylyltransferase